MPRRVNLLRKHAGHFRIGERLPRGETAAVDGQVWAGDERGVIAGQVGAVPGRAGGLLVESGPRALQDRAKVLPIQPRCGPE